MRKLNIIFGLFWFILLGGGFSWLHQYSIINDITFIESVFISIETIQNLVILAGFWAPLVYIFFYIIQPILFFPSSILTASGAIIFGPVFAWIYAYIGGNLGASTAFFVTKFFSGKITNKNQIIKNIDKFVKTSPILITILLRTIPLFPFNVINYGLSITTIKYRSYFIGTSIGIIPGLTGYIFLGTSVSEPHLLIPTIVFFTILISMAYVLKRKKVF